MVQTRCMQDAREQRGHAPAGNLGCGTYHGAVLAQTDAVRRVCAIPGVMASCWSCVGASGRSDVGSCGACNRAVGTTANVPAERRTR